MDIQKVKEGYECQVTKMSNDRITLPMNYYGVFDDSLALLSFAVKSHWGQRNTIARDLSRSEKMIVTKMKKELSIHLGITKVVEKTKEWFDCIIWEGRFGKPFMTKAYMPSKGKIIWMESYGEGCPRNISSTTIKKIGEIGKSKFAEYERLLEEADKVLNSIQENE